MLKPEKFVRELEDSGVEFFAGVPDSFLNEFCTYLQKNVDGYHHVIAPNEGNAVAIAAGYYIATGTTPLVYMQNSGMGNALNPLVSLAEKHVYSIPMILLIGWRGEPGIGDHEQHKMQGEITLKLLEDMNIPYKIIDTESTEESAVWAARTAKIEKQAVALVVKKGIFSKGKKKLTDDSYPMRREEVIETVLDTLPDDTIYVATTGRATRELYILREERNESHKCDFLNVGSMGHASSVAIGLALAEPERQIVCFDGDAAAIMHMGAFTSVSRLKLPNLIHIVLNNGFHESVGGQPSVGQIIDFTNIAKGCGYKTIGQSVTGREELVRTLKKLTENESAMFIDVRIRAGMRDDLGPLRVNLLDDIDELKEEMQNEKKRK